MEKVKTVETVKNENNVTNNEGHDSKKQVTYIAELDADVDDVVALEYLYQMGVLKNVVLDPYPKEKIGLERLHMIEKFTDVYKEIPENTKVVFIGGCLTKVAEYVNKGNQLDWLVMNGGFVGSNISNHYELPKFAGKNTVRTFNFNCDVKAADTVLKSKNIQNIMLVGKNVCHNSKNTKLGIWKTGKDKEILQEIFEKYHVKDKKLQHDLLACKEGLIKLKLLNVPSKLVYQALKPYNTGLKGSMTQWGSINPKIKSRMKSPYNTCYVAVDWKIR